MTVADASQLCAAKRTDCVLVVDHEEGLSGIFTAKDLAFRVTADGLDPRTTPVAQIMTRNPMVTRDTTSATEALQLMVSRHFRHLPVCNEDGDVVGLLDITKVFHDALSKVERSAEATAQLSSALAGVQSELGPGLGANPHAAAMMAYVDALRDRVAQPDLMSVLDMSLPPPTVTPRTSVREAARLMKERRTTAVCVLEANHTSTISGSRGDQPPKIAGIFTSKDIVLRVIAAGLDASRCSVVRVMTPHPDTAPPATTVQAALKKMHNGHYLNLPVIEDDGRLIGIVDVLKLTYATLDQIEQMSEDRGSEGPMWGKFFETLNTAAPEDDTTSALSSHDHRADSPTKSMHSRGVLQSPMSDVMPGDSASVINETISEVGGMESSVAPASITIDDGTYVFKFQTPSKRTHRFQARHDNYELLRDIIHGKLSADPFFDTPSDSSAHVPDPSVFTLSYEDDEGDIVEITADGDVTDAVRIARGKRVDKVVLFISGGKNWEDAMPKPAPEPVPAPIPEPVVAAPPPAPKQLPPVEEEEAQEEVPERAVRTSRKTAPPPEELLFGVLPKDLALPAAIGFLGVVIGGVFIVSRTSK
jgi:CBS domain-containing protein